MGNLILAVDGGATKTVCAICDGRGKILGVGRAGSSSYYAVNVREAHENLYFAIKEAMLSAGLKEREGLFDTGCFGLTSLDRRVDYQLSSGFISSLRIVNKPVIVSDAVIALYAVTLGKPGIIVIAGTGSVAFGMNEKGETAQAGGKEWLISDEGSAYYIAREGLRCALRDYDGRGERTLLKEMFMEHFGVATFEDVIEEIYKDTSKIRISSLAPIVTEAAKRGDSLAIKILEEAGRELGEAAVAVYNKLNIKNKKKVTVGCVGGVFNAGSFILKPFEETVRKKLPGAIIRAPTNPVKGALILGMKEAGLKITRSILSRIDADLRKWNF